MATFQEMQVEVDGTVMPAQFGHRCTVYGFTVFLLACSDRDEKTYGPVYLM